MSKEHLDIIGEVVELAENLECAAQLPMPAEFHHKCLRNGMATIKDRLRALYVSASGGEDPWAH